MALATKCDRCGSVNGIKLFDIDRLNPNRGTGRKLYDLCPKCLIELRY